MIWADQAPVGSSAPKPTPASAAQAPVAKPATAPKPTKTPSRSGAGRSTAAEASRRTAQTAGKKPPGPTPKKAEKEQKDTKAVAVRRDPFKIPALSSGAGAPPGEVFGPLPPGSRGLIISQLQVEGIVSLDTTKTMIAVVSSPRKLAYFLRENDPVYNGVVSKITRDAVYFKENHLDANGQVTSVEVVKRLSPAPGEGK